MCCIQPALQLSCLARPGSATRGQWLQWGGVHRFIISLFYIVTDLQICISPKAQWGCLWTAYSQAYTESAPAALCRNISRIKTPTVHKLLHILWPCLWNILSNLIALSAISKNVLTSVPFYALELVKIAQISLQNQFRTKKIATQTKETVLYLALRFPCSLSFLSNTPLLAFPLHYNTDIVF